MNVNEPNQGVAVVTGGGAGLGAAFVAELINVGFRVAVIDRIRPTGNDWESRLDSGAVMAFVADVTDIQSVERAFDDIVSAWGRIDVLVNNAGIFGPEGEIDSLDLAHLKATLDTNVIGAINCSRAAWRIMRTQHPNGGRIINNGSISAQVPRPLAVAYTVSKHAITGLTKSLALDGRRHGIACGQIDIGNARTAMTGMVMDGALQADGTRRPEPTFDVSHVARAVAYMATLPLDANVLQLTVTATNMPFVGRG